MNEYFIILKWVFLIFSVIGSCVIALVLGFEMNLLYGGLTRLTALTVCCSVIGQLFWMLSESEWNKGEWQ